MTPVFGSNVIFELKVDDTYYPLLCGTDCTLSVRQETVLKTGPNSGVWRERVARISEWNASVTGLTKIETTDGVLTYFWSLQESIRLVTQHIRLTFTDAEGNGKQITGDALIVLNDINGPASDWSTATINFEGTGAINMDVIAPPEQPDVNWYSDEWATNNGDNFIEGASTGTSPAAVDFGGALTLGADDIILEVDVEGIEFTVVTSGTPTGRQCKFNSGTGRITFPSDLIFDGTQKVFVEFKRIT